MRSTRQLARIVRLAGERQDQTLLDWAALALSRHEEVETWGTKQDACQLQGENQGLQSATDRGTVRES